MLRGRQWDGDKGWKLLWAAGAGVAGGSPGPAIGAARLWGPPARAQLVGLGASAPCLLGRGCSCGSHGWGGGSAAPSCPCPRASRLQAAVTDASGDPAGSDLLQPDLLTRWLLKASLSFSHDFQGKEPLGPRTLQPCPPTPRAAAGTAVCRVPAGAGGAGTGSGPSLPVAWLLLASW